MIKHLKSLRLILLVLVLLIFTSYLIRPSSPFYFWSQAVTEKKVVSPPPQKHFNPETLRKYLTVEASFLGTLDNMSLDFKDLIDHQSVAINEARFWIPASTIKAFVLLELFRQKQLGLINLDNQVAIKAENVVPTELESEEFPRLREGVTTTIKQLAESMIIESNNISYNTLLDLLDRRNINTTLRKYGFIDTTVGEKLNLDDDQLASDARVLGRDFNTTTASDFARLFELIYEQKVPGASEMLAILKRQKLNDMLPVFLPPDITIAHKTGEWDPRYHDGGIIYKPQDPFILTVFTDAGSPTNVARLAQVAYFKDPNLVGQPASSQMNNNKPQTLKNCDCGKKYIAEITQLTKVLGTSTPEASIPLNASDLGISAQDLLVNQAEAKKIQPAIITPGSVLYPYKLLFENLNMFSAVSANQKVDNFLSLAKNRLSEVKALLNKGEIKNAKTILDEGENDLKQAAKFIDKSNQQDIRLSRQKDLQLLHLRKLNNLYFAVLGATASQVKSFQKEAYIDAVYDFYKKNTTEVKPVTRPVMPAELMQQQPIIGVVTQIKDNVITIKTDTGETKVLDIVPDITKSRDFGNNKVDQATTLTQGSKIATLPYQRKDGTTIPLFILKNLPKELPKKSKNVILEINPQQNTLEVQDNKGQTAEVKISPDTIIKGKDTTVSPGGIIAGSSITVSGNVEKTVPTTASGENQTSVGTKTIQTTTNKPTTENKPFTVIKATTITVIKNDSGKKEKTVEKKEENKQKEQKVEPKKAPEPTKPQKPKSWLNIFDFMLTYLHNEG